MFLHELTECLRAPARPCVAFRIHMRVFFLRVSVMCYTWCSAPASRAACQSNPPLHLRPAAVVNDFEIIRFQRNGKERERKGARLDVLRKREREKKKELIRQRAVLWSVREALARAPVGSLLSLLALVCSCVCVCVCVFLCLPCFSVQCLS